MLTKLENVEDVTAAIHELVEIRRTRVRTHEKAKPAQDRQEAARLADLYEIRARMWFELGAAAYTNDLIPDAYGRACAVASKNDQDEERHWRTQAGAR